MGNLILVMYCDIPCYQLYCTISLRTKAAKAKVKAPIKKKKWFLFLLLQLN